MAIDFAPSAADDVAARRAARSAPGHLAHVDEEVHGKVVHVAGRLDVHTVPGVREALHAAVDAGTGDLVVEVDDIVVADATGLGVFVGAHRRAQRCGRRLVLRHVPLPALRLMRVTRLHLVLLVDEPTAGLDVPTEDERKAARRARAEAILHRGTDRAQNRRESTSSMPRKAS
ncbi:anti-anti-sigma factor [Kineococcus rhizosphaerae]|uniref:Anti-anti-sigma factor n=1 Tax=Kineococcus rhizosphaerae TaxID=559628 RepID=A0A2T0QZ24_9ACTN|nr:STAS domain-containing protein [Kineococcus rhizosphaerae]PRY11765.1 anti-anti-sigma factor [Kineococcus rhizosphaerae]